MHDAGCGPGSGFATVDLRARGSSEEDPFRLVKVCGSPQREGRRGRGIGLARRPIRCIGRVMRKRGSAPFGIRAERWDTTGGCERRVFTGI